MAYRTEERAALRLTALVWGTDGDGQMFMEQVQTLDISPMGARLKGLTKPVSTGSILGIQNGDNQGRFEVVWVGERGTEREGQIGVRCIQIGRQTKKSILYLDDQEFELERRKPLLEAFGYTAHIASSPQQAFEMMNAVQFHAVMVDQPFPGANDVTLLDQIKKTQPDTKVIVVTAFPSLVSERVVAMADAFVHKGENQNKLIAAIETLIGPGHTLKWPITRTGQRYKVVVPVSVRVLRRGQSVSLVGTSTDLSDGGVGVKLIDGELIAGEIVTVEFNLPTSPHPMKVYAMVRHRKLDQYGIQFVDITPENRQAITDLCEVLVPMDVPH
ncbi:MAG TPA: PilZ domain-containing protein [Terriglobales bacterium]|nr:PilZ domain-containing protein [Terriglobales bacterium]